MRHRLTQLLILAAMLFAPSLARAQVVINEALINPAGSDGPNEYVELRNTTNAAFTFPAGSYLVGLEGDTAGTAMQGDVQTIFDLSGLTMPANGFVVLAQMGNTYTIDANATVDVGTVANKYSTRFQADSGTDIENASLTLMLITTATAPTLTDDIDANNDCTADGTVFAGWTVGDAIGVLDGDATDCSYAPLTFANGGHGVGGTIVDTGMLTAGYVGRAGNTTGSTAADWIAGDTSAAPPPWTLTATAVPATAVGLALDHIGSANFLNDTPVIAVPGAQTTSEDMSVTFTGATKISIADDAGVQPIKLTLGADSGTLTLSGTTGLTFVTGTNGSGNMVVTGKLADLNTALDGLVLAPVANSSAAVTITVAVDDQGAGGVDGAKTAMQTVAVTVDAVNDAPVNTVPSMQMVLVSGTLMLNSASANGISIADADAGTSAVRATVTVTAGTLNVTAAGAATATGNGTASVQLDGTLTDVNATLDSLVFTAPSTGATVTLTVVADDRGATGAGGAQTDTDTVMIEVSANPFINAPAGPLSFTAANGGTSPEQSFMVTGGNLTGMITVTAPAAFEVATTAGGTFAASVMLPSTGGMVYVHYVPVVSVMDTGDVTYAATGVTTPPTTMLSGAVFRITTSSLPDAKEGTAYSQALAATSGVSPYTWSLVSPPAWVSIDASTGTLSGTPPAGSAGDITLMVHAGDAQTPSQVASASLMLTITGTPMVDAGPDAPVTPHPDAGNPDTGDGGGCCSAGTDARGPMLVTGLVALVLVRRRRRR